jgi:glycosyltransferase involved in cell wall biosynthesis
MRLLHVVAPAGFGGLERVVQTLAIQQQTAGDRVHVAAVVAGTTLTDGDLFSGPLRSAGVDVHTVPVPSRAYGRERAAIAKLAKVTGAEILHTHGYRPDVVDGGAAHLAGAAAVATAHGFTGGGTRNRLYEWLQCRALRRFDAVVAVSRPLAERLAHAGVPVNRIHTLVNAWRPFAPLMDRREARAALALSSEGFAIGWVGRVSREKGLDVLCDALPHLVDLPIHVAVIGEGPERPALEANLRQSGLSSRVSWCGLTPDAARLFSAFDLFVLSSRTEGTPLVLFEAASAGVPIVTTSVGGVPDILAAREAMLVPPENPRLLATAIRDVVQHQAAAAERARLARQRLERDCDVGSWAERYGDVYRSALAAARMR